jgi:Na+/H+-translocating membrane pyrophosphatase
MQCITTADNVGDNVGDVAGMGADLFESFVGSIIAAATLGFSQNTLGGLAGSDRAAAVALPFWIAGTGAFCSIVGCFLIRYVLRYEVCASIVLHYKGARLIALGSKKVCVHIITHFPYIFCLHNTAPRRRTRRSLRLRRRRT